MLSVLHVASEQQYCNSSFVVTIKFALVSHHQTLPLHCEIVQEFIEWFSSLYPLSVGCCIWKLLLRTVLFLKTLPKRHNFPYLHLPYLQMLWLWTLKKLRNIYMKIYVCNFLHLICASYMNYSYILMLFNPRPLRFFTMYPSLVNLYNFLKVLKTNLFVNLPL